jgi:hypothetical protein
MLLDWVINMVRKMIWSGSVYFFVIMILGLILRWKMVASFLPQFQFVHLVHAHSHVAFLGWVFFILLAILLQFGLPESARESRQLKVFFYLVHLSVIGMLISFSLEGYAFFSILFSTIHIFLSYWFAYYFLKHQRKDLPSIARRFFKGSILFNLLSSFGPWGLAVLGAKGLATSPLGNVSIYLYLHLQYSGWFLFVIMGAAYMILHQKGIIYSESKAQIQFSIQFIGVIPSYITSILWYGLPTYLIWIGYIGAVFQFAGLILFLSSVWKLCLKQEANRLGKLLLNFSFLSLSAKALLELGGASPRLADMVFQNRQVILGYLHLTLLGFTSSFLLYYLYQMSAKQRSSLFSGAVYLYVFGATAMIILLFLAGLLQWIGFGQGPWIWEALFASSFIIFLGATFLLMSMQPSYSTLERESAVSYPGQ